MTDRYYNLWACHVRDRGGSQREPGSNGMNEFVRVP